MTCLTNLPDDVLQRVFRALLVCPGVEEFSGRALKNASHACAFALTCRRLWSIFTSLFRKVIVREPHLRQPPLLPGPQLCFLFQVANKQLREIVFGDHLADHLRATHGSAPVFHAIATHCTQLHTLRFNARSLCIAHVSHCTDRIVSAFKIICTRLHTLEVTCCTSDDMWTVCEADMSNISQLVLSVDNPYDCDTQLGRVWSSLSDRLNCLDLRISTYDGSRMNAQGDFEGDGLENFRQLKRRQLPLSVVCIGRLPIRALLLMHDIICEPANTSHLRRVVLKHTEVWPRFMQRLTACKSLHEIDLEQCSIDEQDVETVCRIAAWRLRRFWRNYGHWTSKSQLSVLWQCPNITEIDLFCRYDNAERDVLDYCVTFGSKLTQILVGGSDFDADSAIAVIASVPSAQHVYLSGVRMNTQRMETMLMAVGHHLRTLSFDSVENVKVTDLFHMVGKQSAKLSQMSFPYVKMWSEFVEHDYVNIRTCHQLLTQLESNTEVLDVDELRGQLQRLLEWRA